MKIVVLDGYAANPGEFSWEPLQSLGECIIYDRTPKDKTFERAQNASVILTNKVVITREMIENLPDLKYIGVLATGYNVVDVEAATEYGIIITNIPAYSTESVAQMVFAHIMNITQRVGLHAYRVRNGKWTESEDFCFWETPQQELYGKKIGIIGLGKTGSATARIAQAFGMQVFAYTSKTQEQLPKGIEKMEIDELFKECDIVSLHCPLTPSTKHMVNERRLNLMKESAILINTGRGPLVEEQALADALNARKIYAAGIDVLTQEPPIVGNPLFKATNCFITPHIAWATTSARQRLMNIAINNVKGYIEGKTGKEINCINQQNK